MEVNWYFVMIFIYSSLISNDVEGLLSVFMAVWISSL